MIFLLKTRDLHSKTDPNDKKTGTVQYLHYFNMCASQIVKWSPIGLLTCEVGGGKYKPNLFGGSGVVM